MRVDEIHLEMASREFAELEIIQPIAERMDVSVGIIDVKSYYIETVEDVAQRVRRCLKYAPAERLSLSPDCGLSQTARWAARKKLHNLVAGVLHGATGAGTVIRHTLPHDALLADIRQARDQADRLHLWWLGQSGFLLQWQGHHLLLDPYLSDSLTRSTRQTDKPHVRMTERVIDPARLGFHRRCHFQPQPHRPPGRRNARAAAACQSRS